MDVFHLAVTAPTPFIAATSGQGTAAGCLSQSPCQRRAVLPRKPSHALAEWAKLFLLQTLMQQLFFFSSKFPLDVQTTDQTLLLVQATKIQSNRQEISRIARTCSSYYTLM